MYANGKATVHGSYIAGWQSAAWQLVLNHSDAGESWLAITKFSNHHLWFSRLGCLSVLLLVPASLVPRRLVRGEEHLVSTVCARVGSHRELAVVYLTKYFSTLLYTRKF